MKSVRDFWEDEQGIGIIEIILILVVLVALIILFREQITDIVSNAFSTITDNTDTIGEEISIDD